MSNHYSPNIVVSLYEHVVETRLLAGNFLAGVCHFQHDAALHLPAHKSNYYACKLVAFLKELCSCERRERVIFAQ